MYQYLRPLDQSFLTNVKKYHPDVILLGPQIQYMYHLVIKEVDVPVAVIDMKDFGTMNGEKVLNLALSMMK
jgi:PTS system cellobiose-specific IIB component